MESIYFENSRWRAPWFALRAQSFHAIPRQAVTALWRTNAHLDLFANASDGRVKSIFFENDAWQPAWFRL